MQIQLTKNTLNNYPQKYILCFIFLFWGWTVLPTFAQDKPLTTEEILKTDSTDGFIRERLDSLADLLHEMNAKFFKRNKVLTVALKEAPPFILKKGSRYEGVSIDLWEEIATKLGIRFEYKEFPDMISITQAIRQNKVDICISPLTVTGDRIKDFKFSQPFYIADLVLTVIDKPSEELAVIHHILLNTIQPMMLLVGTTVLFGLLIWLIERHKNPDFQKDGMGFVDGVWWSAVTITTVGYGDKAPKTPLGKLVALIWMFWAVFIISSFTAKMSSAMTVDAIESELSHLQNLGQQTLGSVTGSSSEDFMSRYHYHYTAYPSPLEGLQALQRGEIEGFVYDEPICNYLIQAYGMDIDLKIVPRALSKEYYSFSVPKRNSGLLEVVNPLLVEIIDDVSWKAELYRYDLK